MTHRRRALTGAAALGVVALALPACRPAAEPAATREPTAAVAPAAGPPTALAWRFITHGGSGELRYGDGDPAEGETWLTLSCLPRSGEVSLRSELPTPGPLFIQSGVDGARLPNPAEGVDLPADHPVLLSLRRTARLVVGEPPARRVLTPTPGAPAQVEAFFAYCTTGG